jgi:GT2 family glycosyltransferase
MPLISFVIPCYRQARFIAASVGSALRQRGVEVEAVVVDDGSPDDVAGHLGEWLHDPRLRYIRQENQGLPAARNRGIQESRGEYLNFLDADDWLDETFGATLARVLESNGRLGFAYSDLQRVFEGPATTEDINYSAGASRRLTSGDILPSLLLGGYFTPNCVLIPRRVLDEAGLFDPVLGGHADWDLWLRISARGWRAHYVDSRLAYYRIHGSSMSQDREHMSETRLAALQKLFAGYPARAAGAVHALIDTLGDMYQVNQRLGREYEALDGHFREFMRLREEEAAKNEARFRELTDWIGKLMEAKEWHERRALRWESESARLQAELEQLRPFKPRCDELEERLARVHFLRRAAAIVFPLLSGGPHRQVRSQLVKVLLGTRTRRELTRRFDKAFYLASCRDVPAAGPLPLLHYLFQGYREGRRPSADADSGAIGPGNPLLDAILAAAGGKKQ